MKKNKKKIIITGCNGSIGSALVSFFIKKKFIVIGLDKTKPAMKKVIFYTVNLSNISYVNADQSTFRDLIMKEYRYELLGEGEDAHNNRRRGFDYFLDSVIIPHNTTTTLSDGQAMNFNNKDLTLSEDPNQAMFLPLPLTEINTNELIN